MGRGGLMRGSRVLTELVAGVVDVLAPDGCHLCGARPESAEPVRRMSPVTEAVLTPVQIRLFGLTLGSHPICRNCGGTLVPAGCPSQIESNGQVLTVVSPFFSNARLDASFASATPDDSRLRFRRSNA